MKIDFGGRYYGGGEGPGNHWCESKLIYNSGENLDSIIPGTSERGLKCLFYSSPVWGFSSISYGVCMCIKNNKYKLLGYSTSNGGPTREDWKWDKSEYYRIKSTVTGKVINAGSTEENDIETRLNKYRIITYYREQLIKLKTDKKNLEEKL